MIVECSGQTSLTGTLENRRELLARTVCVTFGVLAIGAMFPSGAALADECAVEPWGEKGIKKSLTTTFGKIGAGNFIVMGGALMLVSGVPTLNPVIVIAGGVVMVAGSAIFSTNLIKAINTVIDVVLARCFEEFGVSE